MTFEIPKITQLPSVTEEAEGGTVADVDQNSEFLSVSVKKYRDLRHSQLSFSIGLRHSS
jgi:hypothetical protein